MYHTINKTVNENPLSQEEMERFLNKIQKLNEITNDSKKQKMFIKLILEFSKDEDEVVYNMENLTLPYEGEQIGNDISFDIEKIPIKLQRILLKYIDIII